ncbi:hypothetical protein CSUI_006025 [Cystoisospora suis]|uniref:Uncharacterized protein n=1 Tax=Cystoisospora suis TaxID=483139 RepID=A0A2C6KVV7_9APIC|nr:hypothetical protein CSUI_006025 [Cystoisospora suis]
MVRGSGGNAATTESSPATDRGTPGLIVRKQQMRRSTIPGLVREGAHLQPRCRRKPRLTASGEATREFSSRQLHRACKRLYTGMDENSVDPCTDRVPTYTYRYAQSYLNRADVSPGRNEHARRPCAINNVCLPSARTRARKIETTPTTLPHLKPGESHMWAAPASTFWCQESER